MLSGQYTGSALPDSMWGREKKVAVASTLGMDCQQIVIIKIVVGRGLVRTSNC
jgi:hypothetical protein